MRIWFKRIGAVVLTFHACAVLSGLIPSGSRLHQSTAPVFQQYLLYSGNAQDWPLFSTAPRFQEFDVRIVVIDHYGRTARLGPILPGFQPYRSRARYYKYFSSLMQPRNRSYLNAYLRRVYDQLRDGSPHSYRAFLLQVDVTELTPWDELEANQFRGRRRLIETVPVFLDEPYVDQP